MRQTTDFALITAADWSKAWDGWLGMLYALQSSVREERDKNGWLTAFLHATMGYGLVLLMLALLLLLPLALSTAQAFECILQRLTASEPWVPARRELPLTDIS